MKRMTTLVLSLSCLFQAYAAGLVEYPAGRNQALVVGVSHGLPGIKIDTDHVTTMAKDSAYRYEVTPLSEKQGTRDAIKKELGRISKLTQSDGTVLFYFSGHGNVGSIYPQDGLLSITDIRKSMEESRAEMGPMARLVLIFDTCHSGSLLDPVRSLFTGMARAERDRVLTQQTSDAIMSEFAPGLRAGYWQNLFVLASSRADETSLAGKDGSEFTNAMYKAFVDTKAANGTLASFVEQSKTNTHGHHPVERFVPANLASELLVTN